jgi:hypothetical protein
MNRQSDQQKISSGWQLQSDTKYFFNILIGILFSLFPFSFFLAKIQPSQAGQFPDGTVFFDASPRLVKAFTTFSQVRAWNAKYYFTIDVPSNVGESLQTITIQQNENLEDIEFKVSKTVVFAGTADNKGQPFMIQEVTQDPQTNTVSVILETPIPPGTTFTVGLYPTQNPDFSGIYLFRVNVFPAGEKTQGLDLGVGRLQFYNNGSRL